MSPSELVNRKFKVLNITAKNIIGGCFVPPLDVS